MNYDQELADYIRSRYDQIDQEPIAKLMDRDDPLFQKIFAATCERDFCLGNLAMMKVDMALIQREGIVHRCEFCADWFSHVVSGICKSPKNMDVDDPGSAVGGKMKLDTSGPDFGCRHWRAKA